MTSVLCKLEEEEHIKERSQVRHMWLEPRLRGRDWMPRDAVPQLQVSNVIQIFFLLPRYEGAPKPAVYEALELLQSECPHLYDELTATGEVSVFLYLGSHQTHLVNQFLFYLCTLTGEPLLQHKAAQRSASQLSNVQYLPRGDLSHLLVQLPQELL